MKHLSEKEIQSYARQHQLSKSTFVKGKQCAKMLYLSKHQRQDQTPPNKATKILFHYGKTFESNFREKFQDGIHLPTVLGNRFHLFAGYTEKLLKTKSAKTIFEAGILHNNVLVLLDVLQQNEDQSYTIYEVKYTQKIKPVVLWDLALQYYVCKQQLGNIESFNIVLKGKKNTFRISDMQKMLAKKMPEIAKEIEQFKTILQQENAPNIAIGSQCFRPYKCAFFDYCRQ